MGVTSTVHEPKNLTKYKTSFLSRPRALVLYRVERPHSSALPVTATVVKNAMKTTSSRTLGRPTRSNKYYHAVS
jgi:hypothetical protein